MLVALVTGLLFGLFPALQSSRTDLNTSLKESSGRSGTGAHSNKTRSLLVTAEIALALILLIGSACSFGLSSLCARSNLAWIRTTFSRSACRSRARAWNIPLKSTISSAMAFSAWKLCRA